MPENEEFAHDEGHLLRQPVAGDTSESATVRRGGHGELRDLSSQRRCNERERKSRGRGPLGM